MNSSNIVCLKYVDGSVSETEEVLKIPHGINFDPDSKLWWITGAHIWVKTHIGGHLLYDTRDGKRLVINHGKPGEVIGLYDVSDPKQVKAMKRDASKAKLPLSE